MNAINSSMFNVGQEYLMRSYNIWEAIDEIIDVSQCEIFTYSPDGQADPLGEAGVMWVIMERMNDSTRYNANLTFAL